MPLEGGHYAVGVVARAPKRGGTLFGYFFGPARNAIPSPSELAYSPEDAVYVCRFYDEPLTTRHWPIIHSSTTWNRSEWPMPEFHNPHSHWLVGHGIAVQYAEENPDRCVGQREITVDEESDYPPDEGVFPDSHLKYRMEELLGVPHPPERAEAAAPLPAEPGVTHWLFLPAATIDQAREQLALLGFDDVVVLDERENGLVDVLVSQTGDVDALRAQADSVEAELTTLATSLGGEYDGTEWALP